MVIPIPVVNIIKKHIIPFLLSVAAQQIGAPQLLADRVFRIDTSRAVGHQMPTTPEETPANNLGEKQSVSENPARLGGVLYFVAPTREILSAQRPFPRHGPGQSLGRVRSDLVDG
jgi:hypothetical protein